jgi:hypothetical protein
VKLVVIFCPWPQYGKILLPKDAKSFSAWKI